MPAAHGDGIAPYGWEGFERPISVELSAGWALGHDNPSFFDLFRGSTFPSITFARFTDVYVDGSSRAAAVDAASVTGTLAGRTDMTISGSTTIELGGRTDHQFDLVTTRAQTPLFLGPAGDFKLDPEFKTRYRILDFPGGGILVIGIHTREGGFDAGWRSATRSSRRCRSPPDRASRYEPSGSPAGDLDPASRRGIARTSSSRRRSGQHLNSRTPCESRVGPERGCRSGSSSSPAATSRCSSAQRRSRLCTSSPRASAPDV